MNANNAYSIATLILIASLASVSIQAAPRSTPVTVANDSANPVPVEQKSYGYVGNSTAATLPNIGINGMHSTCQADFGATARMCTTEEVFKTPNLPSIPVGRNWVEPIVTSVFEYNSEIYYQVSGQTIKSASGTFGINCDSWSNSLAGFGAQVASLAASIIGISRGSCTAPQPVACCLAQ